MKKVLISGAFDLLHSSHLLALKAVKCFGDYLIVNVIPDNRVRAKKGKDRPIQSALEREFIIRHLTSIVDETVSVPAMKNQTQNEYEETVIEHVDPHIFIRSDYNEKIDNYCTNMNVRLIVFPGVEGIDKMHTSDIINKIKKSNTKIS